MDLDAETECYLVEWYRPELVSRSLRATVTQLDGGIRALRSEGWVVQRLMTLIAPTDEVLYSLFAARSPDAVAAACQRAGLPADRVTAAVAT